MRSQRMVSVFVGLAFSLAAHTAFAGNSLTGVYPLGILGLPYYTIGLRVFVESSDIVNHGVDYWQESSTYYLDNTPITVQDPVYTSMPPEPGEKFLYLSFGGSSVPPNRVGTWSVHGILVLKYYGCTVQFGIPVCGAKFYCPFFGSGEPCYGNAQGYLG